jgi:hypothetical protein
MENEAKENFKRVIEQILEKAKPLIDQLDRAPGLAALVESGVQGALGRRSCGLTPEHHLATLEAMILVYIAHIRMFADAVPDEEVHMVSCLAATAAIIDIDESKFAHMEKKSKQIADQILADLLRKESAS